MGQNTYFEIDGRRVRLRPKLTESREIDANGAFVRQTNRFTDGFGEHGPNPVEAGRYLLVWAKGCNWSNRASIVRELLGLDSIDVTIADMGRYEENLGWELVEFGKEGHPELGYRFLSEAYYAGDPDYTGRPTVPALIDKKTGKVANNDYHRLTNYLEVDFAPLQKDNAPDLYPEPLREEIDKLNDWLFDNVNNAFYRCNFAASLKAFSEAYEALFAGLEWMDKRLEDRRFLFGDYVTDSDVRLFTSLARFDYSYSRCIGPCKHRLVDYKNLWPYMRDLWQIPAFKHNTYFKDFAASKPQAEGYRVNTYYDLVLQEMDIEGLWSAPSGREKLSGDPANKFLQAGH